MNLDTVEEWVLENCSMTLYGEPVEPADNTDGPTPTPTPTKLDPHV